MSLSSSRSAERVTTTRQADPAVAINSWLRCRLPRHSPKARVVCIPYAGGGAGVFHLWAAALGNEVEVRAVQLPGRQDRLAEPALSVLSDVVASLAAALWGLPPAPLVLYGHSYGALLAFELSRRLRRHGQAPAALCLAAQPAAQLPRRHEPIGSLPAPQFKAALLRRFDLPRQVVDNDELLALSLPPLRADLQAVETYHYAPEALLDTPITLLHGSQDTLVSRAEVNAWRELTTGTVRFHEVDAGHLFVDTHRDWVLAHVAELLCRTIRG